jgi:hypothetical protein
MKRTKVFLSFAVLFCAVLFFLGCPNGNDEDDDDKNYGKGEPQEKEIEVTTGVVYYSLTTGTAVTDPAKIASKDWDIAFQRSRMIYTNSGATATNVESGGLGGVWFTNKTNFNNVSDEDSVETTGNYAEYDDFIADVTKYMAGGGMGGGSGPTPSIFNVMTYWGFKSGTGTSTDPYTSYAQTDFEDTSKFVPYGYNKKNYVKMTSMMGPNGATYEVSQEVYIVKHGNGVNYSKIQITEYTSRSADNTATPPVAAADILKIKYQNF